MFLFGKTKQENKKLKIENSYFKKENSNLKKENSNLKKENSFMKKKVDKVASDGLRHGSSEGAKHLAEKRRK